MGAVVAGMSLFGGTAAQADTAPHAEVLIIHATKCAQKSVDPKIGEAPPALGYDCLKLLDTKTMPLVLNAPSTTQLPNNRTFQLVHTGKADSKFKVTASISNADGTPGFSKLADVSADPNKTFNVGGWNHQGGVLLLTVKIVP